LTGLVLILEWFVFSPLLRYVTLFYGVFFNVYAVRDIWDDTVSKTTDGSDAVVCHQNFSYCQPKCVGVQFLVMAVAFQVLGLYLALVWLVSV